MAAALALLLALPPASGCRRAETGEAPPGAAAGQPATQPGVRDGTLQVTPALQQKWGITTAAPARSTAAAAVSLPGVLRLNERQTAQVSSLLEGQVVSLGAELGAAVRKGQVLATIHAPALAQAKTAFLQASARAALTAREWERARVLLEQEAIDQKESARRKADFEQARTDCGGRRIEPALVRPGSGGGRCPAPARAAAWRRRPPRRARRPLPDIDLAACRSRHRAGCHRGSARRSRTGRCSPCPTSPRCGRHSTRASRTCRSSPRASGCASARPSTRTGRGTAGFCTSATWSTRRPGRSRSGSKCRTTGLLLKPNMFVQGEVAGVPSTRDVLTVPADAHPDDQRRAGGVRPGRRGPVRGQAGGNRRPRRRSARHREGARRLRTRGDRRRVHPQGRVAEVDAGGRVAPRRGGADMLERLMALSLRNRLAVLFLVVLVIVGRGRVGGPHDPDRRLPGRHEHPGRGGQHGAGPVAARDRAVRHLPDRELDARPARPRADAIGHEVRPLGRHDRLRGRRGHLLRPAAGLRAAGRGRAEACRRAWRPTMGPIATAMGEIYQYTLESPGPGCPGRDAVDDLARLRTLQDWVVTPLLKSVPGVTEINSFGGYLQQYQVMVDPEQPAEVRPAARRGRTTRSATTTRTSAAASSRSSPSSTSFAASA